VVRSTPLCAILGASVHAVGNTVGLVTDVYADETSEYVLGLEVSGANERRWFLPWVATTFEEGVAQAASPLVFIPAEQLDFYIERCTKLAGAGTDGVLVQADGRFVRSPDGAVKT
jgi:PRC-barrel domain protein